MCVISLSASGEASLLLMVLLVPANAPPESWLHFQGHDSFPGSARLSVCQAEESPSEIVLSSFLRGP